MKKLVRRYKGSDVEMLTVAASITAAAIAHKTELQAKRSTWADPYFQNLAAKIDTATQTYVGVDAGKEMRSATQALTLIQTKALNDLSELKVQVEEDFKKDKPRRDEILKQTGIAGFYNAARKRSQEDLVSLLYSYKKNMTATLKNEIAGKGTAPELINNIMGYADTLNAANITQETFKSGRKNITTEVVDAFNIIYDEVVSIARIASNFFKSNAATQDKFNYTKLLAAINSDGKIAKPPVLPKTANPA